MKLTKLYTIIIAAVLLVVLSLVFVFVGIATPSESFDDQNGFGKVFAASPELSFDSGSLVMSCGEYSLSINFGFSNPWFSLLTDGKTIHIQIILVLLLVAAMIVSCSVSEVSIATSGVVAVVLGIASFRLIPIMEDQIASGASSWDVAAGSFWFISFLFSVLIVNGIIGIGGEILRSVFLYDAVRITVTFLAAMLLANAVSLILGLFVYITVGLGWCAGLLIWLLVAIVLVAFCEFMDIVGF